MQPATTHLYRLKHVAPRRFVRYVMRQRQDRTAGRLDRVNRGGQALRVDIGDDDPRIFARQGSGASTTDPGCPARHHRDLTVQQSHAISPIPVLVYTRRAIL